MGPKDVLAIPAAQICLFLTAAHCVCLMSGGISFSVVNIDQSRIRPSSSRGQIGPAQVTELPSRWGVVIATRTVRRGAEDEVDSHVYQDRGSFLFNFLCSLYWKIAPFCSTPLTGTNSATASPGCTVLIKNRDRQLARRKLIKDLMIHMCFLVHFQKSLGGRMREPE